MPLDTASEFIRDELQAMQLFDERYTDVKLVNFDSASGIKRGCFSLVFSANDLALGRRVALKFFEPQWNNDIYRLSAFRREHAILEQLLNAERCLQLTASLRKAQFSVSVPGRSPFQLTAEYFAVEWIDGQLDEFFLGKMPPDSVNRLRLFNEIVLAVEALHRRELFHRDLKHDNLRSYQDAAKRVVVAIDLGTAARVDSGLIQNAYGCSVGALGYAGSEARCGLAGNRQVARFTDLYAMGCMLFELFNPGYFFKAIEAANPRFDIRLAAMASSMSQNADPMLQLSEWHNLLAKYSGGVVPVIIDGPGSDVPKAVSRVLNELLAALTHIDYRNRPRSLAWVRQKVWAAIRILESEKLEQRKVEEARRRRALRAAKARRLDVRMLQNLQQPEATRC